MAVSTVVFRALDPSSFSSSMISVWFGSSGAFSMIRLIFSMSPVGRSRPRCRAVSSLGIMFGRAMVTRMSFGFVLLISMRAASRRCEPFELQLTAQCSSISEIRSLPDLMTMVPFTPLPTGLVMSTL